MIFKVLQELKQALDTVKRDRDVLIEGRERYVAEHDAAVKQAEAAEAKWREAYDAETKATHTVEQLLGLLGLEIDATNEAAVSALRQLREENARLRAFTPTANSETWRKAYGESQALLGRAVAALQETLELVGSHRIGAVEIQRRVDQARAILADATATQAADAWRAQQEERAELEALIPFVRLAKVGCLTVRQQCEAYAALAKVDARRGGG